MGDLCINKLQLKHTGRKLLSGSLHLHEAGEQPVPVLHAPLDYPKLPLPDQKVGVKYFSFIKVFIYSYYLVCILVEPVP